MDYERVINRAGDDEIMDRWQNENSVKITKYEDMDIDSFKQAVDGVVDVHRDLYRVAVDQRLNTFGLVSVGQLVCSVNINFNGMLQTLGC